MTPDHEVSWNPEASQLVFRMFNQLNEFKQCSSVMIFCIKICVTCANIRITWWHHQMETFSALLVLCAGIHRSPVNSPHRVLWRGALMFSLICVRINGWVNNREAGDLRRCRAHYDVIFMLYLENNLNGRQYQYILWLKVSCTVNIIVLWDH